MVDKLRYPSSFHLAYDEDGYGRPCRVSDFPKGTRVVFNDPEDAYHDRRGVSQGPADNRGYDVLVIWDTDGTIERIGPDLLFKEEFLQNG